MRKIYKGKKYYIVYINHKKLKLHIARHEAGHFLMWLKTLIVLIKTKINIYEFDNIPLKNIFISDYMEQLLLQNLKHIKVCNKYGEFLADAVTYYIPSMNGYLTQKSYKNDLLIGGPLYATYFLSHGNNITSNKILSIYGNLLDIQRIDKDDLNIGIDLLKKYYMYISKDDIKFIHNVTNRLIRKNKNSLSQKLNKKEMTQIAIKYFNNIL